MREDRTRPARRGSVQAAAQTTGRPLRAIAAIAFATAIGFMPTFVVTSPAQAAAGGVTMAVTEIEGTEGDGLIFELRREAPAGLGSLTLNVAVGGGTATPGVDYTVPATTTTFAATTNPGDQVKRITVKTLDDDLDEADTENFNLTITGPGNLSIQGFGIIDDDEDVPAFNLTTAATVAEDGGPATITATLTGKSSWPTSIPVLATPGTAAAPSDYTDLAPDATIDIAAGALTGTIQVPIIDDTVDEAAIETFTVSMDTGRSPPSHVVVGTTTSVPVNIVDNDGLPVVSIGGGGVAVEGNPVHFTVNLDGPSATPVTVRVTTTDGTSDQADAKAMASGGGVVRDYTPRTNYLVTVPAGQLSTPVDVATVEDAHHEPTEMFTLTESNPTNATLGTTSAMVGAISDNDDAPTATLTPTTVTEGNTDTVATFTVHLDSPSDEAATVVYTVGASGSGLGFAAAGDDFTAAGPTTLTFAPGEQDKTFNVAIKGDTIDEGSGETFKIALSNFDSTVASAGSIGVDTSITLTDDDSAPSFSVADVSRAEGNPAGGVSSNNASFTVTLDHVSVQPIDFVVGVANGTAVDGGSAAGSNDFDPPPATVQIPALATSATINVPVNLDTVFEADETATLNVSRGPGETDAVGGTDASTLTLTNDDAVPSIVLNTDTATEGAGVEVAATVTGVAQADMVFALTLTGSSAGSNDPAESGDYVDSHVNGTIPGGTASGTTVPLRVIALNNDHVDEPEEAIQVGTHDIAENVADRVSVYKITDNADDMTPMISVQNASVAENAGPAAVPVALDFSAAGNDATSTEKTLGAHYATADDTATTPGDYTAASGDLSFTGDATPQNVEITLTNDSIYEASEGFTVGLSAATPNGVTFGHAAGIVTITDEDSGNKPTFTVAGPTTTVTEGTTTTADVTVTLSSPNTQPVDFTVTGVDAEATRALGQTDGTDDYAVAASARVPAGGCGCVTIPVTIKNDNVYEGVETADISVALA
jgi:hypothetical protein